MRQASEDATRRHFRHRQLLTCVTSRAAMVNLGHLHLLLRVVLPARPAHVLADRLADGLENCTEPTRIHCSNLIQLGHLLERAAAQTSDARRPTRSQRGW